MWSSSDNAQQSDFQASIDQLKSQQSYVEHHVQTCDTLRSIAVTYNTTTSALMKLNKLSSTFIFPEQVLYVPKNDSNTDPVSTSPLRPSSVLSFEGDYSFLAPLSVTTPTTTTEKFWPSVSSSDFAGFTDVSTMSRPTNTNMLSEEVSSSPQEPPISNNIDRTNEFQIERMLSNNSVTSESCEENFVKISVHYVTPTQQLVKGVLLVTPTSVMFDPDPNDLLCVKHGCEMYGIMCTMNSINSVTMFVNKGTSYHTNNITSTTKSLIAEENTIQPSDISCKDNTLEVKDEESDEMRGETHDNFHQEDDKLKLEFPLLHSLVKSVEELLPKSPEDFTEKIFPSTSQQDSMYMCIRSKIPMMKTFSFLSGTNQNEVECSSGTGSANEEHAVQESWFQLQRRRSEQLLAFFTQWNPDPYALDFAEQNGFILTDVSREPIPECDGNKISVEKRASSSSNTTLDFIEDFFACSNIEKEWEIVSVEEAKRRSITCAMDFVNMETSPLPELKNSSNLIKTDTLLELCNHLPARSVGYPWKLLYSTYEHGMSLRTLYRNVNKRGEDSPVIMLIQDYNNYLFGVFCSVRPHISDHFYGTGESFLFTLDPTVQFFDWSGENNFYIKGDSDALTFGGGDGSSGLWLDGDLCHGSSHACLTFNNSMLSASEDFFIQGVEVWGFDDS